MGILGGRRSRSHGNCLLRNSVEFQLWLELPIWKPEEWAKEKTNEWKKKHLSNKLSNVTQGKKTTTTKKTKNQVAIFLIHRVISSDSMILRFLFLFPLLLPLSGPQLCYIWESPGEISENTMPRLHPRWSSRSCLGWTPAADMLVQEETTAIRHS